MASVHIPRVRSNRGKTQVQIDRENFEKNQHASIAKAINVNETPVKEKHARIIILGTHHDKSGQLFWFTVQHLQLQGHPILCWKFCHVLHKMLRDGHPQVLIDSRRYTGFMTELGKLWGHLRDGYGKLIAYYTKLLIGRLAYHSKYPEIPGNLLLRDDQLEKMCAHDINSYFELSVDMLDCMDDILALQAAVFGSLDMSRSNSMTPSGQCRLAPLILCVQDSCQVYDYIVKLLFKLHSSLPPDTLGGHRDRFYQQYESLKKFYSNSTNLQYFKHLISVPVLPSEPPNFLRAADLTSHVKPVAVVPEAPAVSENDSAIDLLVDTSSTTSSLDDQARFEETFPQNGAHSPPEPTEKERTQDRFIEHLMKEVERLKAELLSQKAESAMMMESLQSRIQQLEMELSEMKQIAESTSQENETLRDVVKESEQNNDATHKLASAAQVARASEEKFKKMKDIYTKLREEHVNLLRTHAEVTRQMKTERELRTEAQKEEKDLSQRLAELEMEKKKVEVSLEQTSSETVSKLTEAVSVQQRLGEEKQGLESQLASVESTKTELERSLAESRTALETLREEHGKLQSSLQEFTSRAEMEKEKREEAEARGQDLSQRLAELEMEKKKVEVSLEQTSSETVSKLTEAVNVQQRLDEEKQSLASELASVESARAELEQSLTESKTALETLQADLVTAATDRQTSEHQHQQAMSESQLDLLVSAVEEGQVIIREALDQHDNPSHSTVMCPAEYLIERTRNAVGALGCLRDTCGQYGKDKKVVGAVIKAICDFSHHLGDIVILGFATSHSASIEAGEELAVRCKDSGEEGIKLLDLLKQDLVSDVPAQADTVQQLIDRLVSQAEELLPKIEDVQAEKMGDLVDQEMALTTKAIEDAASKIAAMLAKSREAHSGVQLEVNERILDSCDSLMMAIKVLIEKSKSVQKEIVTEGRGASSSKDFYKKHHRWTEGLISAAKAVGWGANVLVEAADKVVTGSGKFEELVVCSQEVAASTTQLVVSSKVKAPRGSKNLPQLAEASRNVTAATGKVVASAKSAAQMIEDLDTMAFSKLTLHQAKRYEMESQVRVLELQSDLEKERIKLSELRKMHYRLAGESEGWEQEDIDSQQS